MTLINKLAAAVISVGILSTSVFAADAMSTSDSSTTTTTVKKHKKHKKVMADSTVTTATASADTTTKTTVKKHKKHKKAAMADSSSMSK